MGYKDNVGGYHDSAMGWAPDGRFCGECTTQSCEDCKVWEWRLKYGRDYTSENQKIRQGVPLSD